MKLVEQHVNFILFQGILSSPAKQCEEIVLESALCHLAIDEIIQIKGKASFKDGMRLVFTREGEHPGRPATIFETRLLNIHGFDSAETA